MPLIFILFIIACCTTYVPSYADEPRSALDKEPSVDASAQQIPTKSDDRPAAPAAAAAAPESAPAAAETSDAAKPGEADLPVMPEGSTTGYVYDLKKLIVKSRANIKRVNEKIKEQAVIKRNQKREERAREYYQRGLQLSEEGKLDEAREYFEKAVRITEHPEMTRYIQKSEYRLRAQTAALQREQRQQMRQIEADETARQQQAREAYDTAVRFYKEKKYKEAKDSFEHADELLPDYKATRSYLKIIDQDIIASEALAQKQQKKEMARQEKEAEAAREREKEVWKKEIDRKEQERHAQVNKQAQDVYEDAVRLYKEKKFAEAKKKFDQVEWVIPDYKATRSYLARADKDIAEELKRVEAQKAKDLAEQQWQEAVDARKKEAAEKKATEEKEKEQRKQLEDQAAFLYKAAITLYNGKVYDQSLEKFNDIEKLLPNYKSTRMYVAKIGQMKEEQTRRKALAEAKAKGHQPPAASKDGTKAAPADAAASTPAAPQPAAPAVDPQTKAEQIQQAKDIAQLAEQSQLMYQQIALLASDRRIVPAKKKMAEVDQVLSRLKAQKERLLTQLAEDEKRARAQQLKEEREAARAKIEVSYDEAIMLLRNGKFDEAKAKFMSIESVSPNYKATRRYLSHIDDDRKKAEQDAAHERTLAEQRHLKETQEKERAQELVRQAAEEERQRKLRETQDQEVESLAQKAFILNEEILLASKQGDFKTAKAKFAELGGVLQSLQDLKIAMMGAEEKAELLRKQRDQSFKDEQARRARASGLETPASKNEGKGVEVLKQQEVREHQEENFKHGVDLYSRKKYSAAKIVFEDLAARNDRRAKVYLAKVNRIMEKEVHRVRAEEEKERSAYIADRQRQERRAKAFADKEISHHREATQALEKQKRLRDDSSQRERIRAEAIEVQKKERKELEQKRKEAQARAKPENYDFRKVKADSDHVVPAAADEDIGFSKVQKDGEVSTPVPAVPKKETAPEKAKSGKPAEKPADKKDMKADDRLTRTAGKLSPKEEGRSLDERRAAIELSKKRQKFFDDQHKNKLIEEEKLKREERARADEEARIHREKLEAERRSIQEKLGEGVKIMYRDAMQMYKRRQYKSAAQKFQDIEDILPNYKHTRRYLEKSNEQIAPMIVHPALSKSSSSYGSREQDIRKTLDLFDPNAK